MAENQNGVITGYAAGIGLFGHAVAKSNECLKILISFAPQFVGPGFFVPARNWELLNWLLENDSQIAWPATLMTCGAYQNPRCLFFLLWHTKLLVSWSSKCVQAFVTSGAITKTVVDR